MRFNSFSIYERSIFAIFYRLDWMATVPPTVNLPAQKFGEKLGANRAPLVFGWRLMGHQLNATTSAYSSAS